MKQQLVLGVILLLALTGGCATSDMPPMVKTASTMTQHPDDYRPSEDRRYTRRTVRRQTVSLDSSSAAATEQATRPKSRAERAMDVLRRSPIWRFGRTVRGIFIGPANPAPQATVISGTSAQSGQVIVGQPVETGSGIKSSVTGTPVEPVPGLGATALAPTAVPPGPTPTAATPVVQPTTTPGAGRVIVGSATGSGLRSTVTGTPVEPIPGVTPASQQLQPTTNPNTPTVVTGTATTPSLVDAEVDFVAPPDVIAPDEPAPGTTVTNTEASESTVEVRTEPDGTQVIVNTDETPEATKKKKKAKTSPD